MDFQFYPTPESLAERAWAKFKTEIVRVLEPSAGEGHLAKKRPNHDSRGHYGHYYGSAPAPVDCIEIDVTKHAILREEGFDVVGIDFMRFTGAGAIYSHILLNPPFLEGAKHVLKAWEILYEGEVVAILNAETIRNPFSKEREILVRLIAQHGEVEFIEGAFAGPEAERKTDVDVALVYLKKESSFGKDLMGDILDGLKREGHIGLDAGFEEANELAIPANFIENSVLAFAAAVKSMRASVFAEARANRYASRLGMTMEQMNAEQTEEPRKADSSLEWVRRELYKRHSDFKNRGWSGILRSTEVLSRLSSAAQKRIESEFESIKRLEFTVSNIYGFLGGLIAKQGDIQIGMACDCFDSITRYHSDNQVHFMGWKSNDRHRVAGRRIRTTRFVLPGHKTESYSRGLSWDSQQLLRDFDKVFAMLDGRVAPENGLEAVFDNHFSELRNGGRVSSSYFDVRFYPQRGTIHFFARDKKLVDRLNKLVGAYRQWLPPEGVRVSDAFWLQYDKAEQFDKEIRVEASKGTHNWYENPFDRMRYRDGSERDDAEAKVTAAIATVLEKHGIDPNALLEAPTQEATTPALPLLAAA